MEEQFQTEFPLQIQGNFDSAALLRQFNSPPKDDNFMVHIRLSPGDLIPARDHYSTMWSIFFVDRKWIYTEGNLERLSKLIPCFMLVEMPCPFREPEDPDKLPIYNRLRELFTTRMVILPFKKLKPFTRDSPAKITFIGAWIPKEVRHLTGRYRLSAYEILVDAVNMFGHVEIAARNVPGSVRRRSIQRSYHVFSDMALTYQRPNSLAHIMCACEESILDAKIN